MRNVDSIGALRTGDLTEDLKDDVRVLAKDNLYILVKAILGYKDLVPRVHRPMAALFERESKRKLLLAPRGHFKTTMDLGDCIRRLILDPEETILLVSESAENAEAMLGEIKSHFTSNPVFQQTFPDVIPPDFNKTNWTKSSITIPRKRVHREGSIEAAGVTSKIVSRHYSIIKNDDIISMEAKESPTVMRKANDFYDYESGLQVPGGGSEVHTIGTRWAFDDTYGRIIDKEADYTDIVVFKPIVQGVDGPEPWFKEFFSMEEFQRIIEKNPEQWSLNYANDPLDAAVTDFRPEWLQWCTVGVDKALRWEEDGLVHRLPMHELRYYIHVDPSMGESPESDYSGIVVIGLSCMQQIFVVDAIGLRLDPPRLIDKLCDLVQVYNPKLVSIESNVFQKVLVYDLKAESKRRGFYVRVEDYKAPTNKRKPARIRGALQTPFANRMVWVRKGLVEFADEFIRFGKTEDEHLLDAMAQGPDYWRFPESPALKRKRELRKDRGRSRKGWTTGYGL